MRAALAQARRALGRSFPNPPVGALVFRGDEVLGRGSTRRAGGPHAEVVALEAARRAHGDRALRGAEMAVTLEPCCHRGRTGPCTEAIEQAGIARVWVGQRDPNPAVAGRGLARLRRRGLRVESGVLEAECREQHRGFNSVQERGWPFVGLKLAATLDGRLATASGESRWITGPEARRHVHRLRDRADAVMVGSTTARVDDPSLTVRRGERVRRCPVRVVVDSRLRLPAASRLASDPWRERTWVLTSRGAPATRRRALQRAGVRLLDVALARARADRGHLNLVDALRALALAGLTEVLVEGGGGLASALLRAGLVDEVHWYTAPALLGGDARAALGPLRIEHLAGKVRVRVRGVRRMGEDLYVHGMIDPERKPRG